MSIFENHYGELRTFWSILAFVCAVPAMLAIILTPFLAFDYFATKDSCPKYGEQIGREVQFVSNPPYYWSCQVKTDSGYIDYSKLHQIETPNIRINSNE